MFLLRSRSSKAFLYSVQIVKLHFYEPNYQLFNSRILLFSKESETEYVMLNQWILTNVNQSYLFGNKEYVDISGTREGFFCKRVSLNIWQPSNI